MDATRPDHVARPVGPSVKSPTDAELDALRDENRDLRELVVHLSRMILRSVVEKQ
jgi:hypothetical protein